jgi:RPA family protein
MEKPETQIKRDVAAKIRVKDVLDGKYIREEGWKPNYIITAFGENIARLNIMAVVVSNPIIDEKNQNITVDDGSGRVQLRSFEGGVNLSRFVLGDVINIIGKPKEYMGSKYVVPEIIKPIKNNKWLEVRKKELEFRERSKENVSINLQSQNTQKDQAQVEEESVEEENKFEKVIKLVRSMDAGTGVFIGDLMERLNNPESEKTIKVLLEQGDIFEIQSGKIKVLE